MKVLCVLSGDNCLQSSSGHDHNVVHPLNQQLLPAPASTFPLHIDHFTVVTQTL